VLFGLLVPWRTRRGAAERAEEPDGVLIVRARDGDLDAFNQLVARHERAVYNTALRYMRAADLAEDVSQDTFVRAFRALHTFRNDAGEGFRAWLLSIAANRARDVLRAQARRPADSIDARLDDDDSTWEPEGHDESPLDFASRDELAARLEWALGRLAPDQRLTVILSDVQGHSYEEVAQITGVALGTVKSRLNRGRARLREILLAEDGGRELLGHHGRLVSGDDRG
jgi:RNA polymerase sigma-70 factor (ECF subfamily)